MSIKISPKVRKKINLIKDKLELLEAIASKYTDIPPEKSIPAAIEGLLIGDRNYHKFKRSETSKDKSLYHEHYVTWYIKTSIEKLRENRDRKKL